MSRLWVISVDNIKRKGQFLSLLTVFTLAFIGSGHIFSEVAQGTIISGEADRAVGDPDRIAETKVYTEIYEDRVPVMANYSAINGAHSLSNDVDIEISSSGDIDKDSWMSDWEDETSDNLEARNRINNFRCSSITPPDLEIDSLDGQEIEVSVDGDHVVCEASDIDVYISHGLDDLVVELEENRFEQLLSDSEDAAEDIEDDAELDVFEGSYETDCVDDADIGDAEDGAADEVWDNALDNVDSGLGGFTSGFDYDLNVDSDSSVDIVDSGVTNDGCDDDEEKAEAEAELDPDNLLYGFELVDEDNEVLTEEGSTNLSFGFTFVVD